MALSLGTELGLKLLFFNEKRLVEVHFVKATSILEISITGRT